MKLLQDMAELVEQGGGERAAVRLALRTCEGWMQRQQLNLCQQALKEASPEKLGVSASIGLLAALFPVRETTKSERIAFVEQLKAYIRSHHTPKKAKELILGLA